MNRYLLAFLIALVATVPGRGAESDKDFPAMPPVQALSAAESLATMELPPGYRLELVLSEPQIKEPVVCAFDGNGRMFVAEMRTYMQDAEGTGELVPESCVSLHTDTDGDGKYDRHTVFADKLLLPRMILPLGNGQLVINETNTLDLYLYTDTDGDGIADKKELWWQGGPRGGNLEHQPSGLIWAVDNWLYTTYNAFRLRWTPKGVVKEPAASNGGQWGIGQDNYGKLFFMNGGGERGPVSFQVPIAYAELNPKAQTAPGFAEVWPLVGVADVQGGVGRFRPENGTLNHFTATSGAEIFRGDRLPVELQGDLFFGEPVGRLVRRAQVEVKDGLTILSNPHQEQKAEFIRSTDLCFRPLNMVTAPDGTLYIVDMYRGIIQEGNWTRPGSYLRKVLDQYAFEKVIGRGRIWRLVHETTKLGPQPKMLGETASQLVAHLGHPNGWWRDTAQKLLVLKQEKLVVPALRQMARTNPNHLARLHALWTLEGLGAADAALIREKLKDEHPQLRLAAVRVSETLFKNGDQSVQRDIRALVADRDPNVALQTALTARSLKWPEHKKVLEDLVANTAFAGVKELGSAILNPPVQSAPVQMTAEQKAVHKAGAEIYNTLCATCHGPDGKGLPMVDATPGAMLAPAVAGSKTVNGHPDGGIYVMLHGLTGEIDGKKYEGLMIPMATNDDKWIASVLSYVRTSFGNKAGFVSPDQVARLRETAKDRTQPWTITELRAALPQLLDRKGWKVSASHNSAEARAAIDGNVGTRYATNTSQTPGMWFQVEMPQATEMSGVLLDAAASSLDYPRGYTVELSADGMRWSKPVAAGKGARPLTEITFPAARAKFIRIHQTGAVNGLFWSIHELQLYAPNPRRSGVVSASTKK